MFLKSLAVRGFKSFADKTVLEFSPGVSVIVGPNGSGKSNLVDAIAWVLGEQGPKTLRGGKMEDVIFAGAPARQALGRAEVSLTIDNSRGVLPIEFTEVTIRRTLYRSGESEYAINGVPCRLLDIQELLSDTGIGRELHTIVSQGQLDDVLDARPEERRAWIEEAAGVLKHRKRKERAVRKLERVDHDIERIADVISELRRQIRPLERQAELATRAAAIETELREVRLKLWVLEFRALTGTTEAREEAAAGEEVLRWARALREAESRLEGLEEEMAEAARAAETALECEYRLESQLGRFEGLAGLARERARHLDDMAAREPRSAAPSEGEVAVARAELEGAHGARADAEADAALADAERRAMAAARDETARVREQLLHLSGERSALRASVEAAEEERLRLSGRRTQLARSREERGSEAEAVRAEIERLEIEETQVVGRMEEVEARRAAHVTDAEGFSEQARALEREVASLETRRSLLVEEVARRGGPAAVLAGAQGILGRIRDLVEVREGFEEALRAALEPLAEALLASSRGDAIAAVERLKAEGGRAAFLIAGEISSCELPSGVRSVLEVVSPKGPGAEAVSAFLGGVGLAGSLAEAVAIARSAPGVVAVTADGDRVGPDVVIGGSAADARDPQAELGRVEAALERTGESLERARRHAGQEATSAGVLEREATSLAETLDDIDARLTGAAEGLAQAERDEHAAEREDGVVTGRLDEVCARAAEAGERLVEVEAHLARAVAGQATVPVEALVEAERAAAERSLRLGELVERERSTAARLADLEARAREAGEMQRAWESGHERYVSGAAVARVVTSGAESVGTQVRSWAAQALERRLELDARREALAEELGIVRRSRREAESAAATARDRAHDLDLRRAEREHRIEALSDRLHAEYSLNPGEAEAAVSAEPEEADDLGRRAEALARRLALVGRANPILMEQYQGLVDRHTFLTEQVSDLKRSRKDLVAVVAEVDLTIERIFCAAFEDVAREFTETFGRLFPGGEGGLSLSDPGDLLNTGVEVEARPAGKRVKRISLLSGGERALTAIALLFAIFRARPSPFYLLDEVEAALDDINLHRFLELARDFREKSQLLVVTHQKRTMEIADALYGISMAGEGVSRVICERLAGSTTAVDA